MMQWKRFIPAGVILCALVAGALAASGDGDDYPYIPYDHPAIQYPKRAPEDPVARLQKQLDKGEVKLDYDAKWGYLPGLLKHFGIDRSSQMLVFSKTSFQAPKISPARPRALYFGDDVAVGFVPDGDVMEFTGLDPQQGIEFYTLDRERTDHPSFVHRTGECLNCHLIPGTLEVPSLLVTSVIPKPDGTPRFPAAAVIVDSRTPLDQRWGGWYVTGTSGSLLHRGNAVAPNPDQPSVLDLRNAQNLTDLSKRLDTSTYLEPTSDIVALMTLEHQTRMVSLLTRLNWETRVATQEGKLDAFHDRLNFLAAQVASYMLFEGEATMYEPIKGVSSFTQTFAERGPRDKRGRSLRDFDLQKRLFRYPLSYMIYDAAFDGLPAMAKEAVYQKLFAALTQPDDAGGANQTDAQAHGRLSPEDRQNILEILRDTKPDLPAYWNTDAAAKVTRPQY